MVQRCATLLCRGRNWLVLTACGGCESWSRTASAKEDGRGGWERGGAGAGGADTQQAGEFAASAAPRGTGAPHRCSPAGGSPSMSARQAAARQRVTGTSCSMQRSRGQGQGRHLNALLPPPGGWDTARPPARPLPRGRSVPKPARPGASVSLGTHARTAPAYLLATRRAPLVPRFLSCGTPAAGSASERRVSASEVRQEGRSTLVVFEANSLPLLLSTHDSVPPDLLLPSAPAPSSWASL